ncbi:30S ribosomal protein S8 [Candidatus Peregrinibacteria bacterium HGW-Peregrinibacteria-1]|jgi:small subunit ribosomal protein S8|nr:ribosomal protein S8 [uncultured bacterium]PKL36315.1 MAG: 30S ribosomal protein S8 [Candidatus Peregrinibacteria bacterium HGW-Peregrinibacteria-1]
MHTDPIADLLTRIRNGLRAHHQSVNIGHSNIKEDILKVLKERNFILDYKVTGELAAKNIEIFLNEDLEDLTLKRISKPGQRIYIKHPEIRTVKSGLGIQIISTSKGVMTNYEAKKGQLGGELLCEIY